MKRPIRDHVPAYIALATGTGTMSIHFWYPFVPLFLLEIGARNDAEAAFWVAAGIAGQGIGRLFGGPLWGALSDRVGRKRMFLRGLLSAGAFALFLGFIQSPWQLVVIMVFLGVFSGFNPAAIALVSVSVPDSRVRSAVGLVAGGQYVGMAIGPAIGALLGLLIGFRATAAVSGLIVIGVAMVVSRHVPADRIGEPADAAAAGKATASRAPEPFRLGLQLSLAIILTFAAYCLNSLRTVSTAIALRQIDTSQAMVTTGIAFSLAGVASAIGVFLVSSGTLRRLRLRDVLAVTSLLSGLSYFALAVSDTAAMFIAALAVGSLLNASMFPGANTLIALNTGQSRRGTAFGVASGAQALAFVAGPMAGALFAATSLSWGFAAVGAAMTVLAAVIALLVREPVERAAAAAGGAPTAATAGQPPTE